VLFAAVLFVMTECQTFNCTDLPNYARISQAEDTPGVNHSAHPLLKYKDQICAAVHANARSIVVIHAATGSGKSKVLPSFLQEQLTRPLLCLVTSTVDVVDMFLCAKVPACYRMGNSRRGGSLIGDSKIVFATVGLVLRWYAKEGHTFLSRYGGVLFDEVGDIEKDPSYALLWEVARQAQSIYKVVLVAASATISTRLIGCFTRLGAAVILCPERQFPVRNVTISIPASSEIWNREV
jgi:HrpA-like RNA helicase